MAQTSRVLTAFVEGQGSFLSTYLGSSQPCIAPVLGAPTHSSGLHSYLINSFRHTPTHTHAYINKKCFKKLLQLSLTCNLGNFFHITSCILLSHYTWLQIGMVSPSHLKMALLRASFIYHHIPRVLKSDANFGVFLLGQQNKFACLHVALHSILLPSKYTIEGFLVFEYSGLCTTTSMSATYIQRKCMVLLYGIQSIACIISTPIMIISPSLSSLLSQMTLSTVLL